MVRIKKACSKLSALFQRVFGKDLPLEYFVFICVAVAGIFMALIGIIGNSTLQLGPITLLAPAIFIVADIGCIAYSVVTRRWRGPAFITLGSSVFMLFPSLWFTTGGATGSTLPLMVTSGLCIVIIFKGKLRAVMLALDALMCVSFIALEYFYPDIYIPYPSRSAWYADMIIGIIVNFAVTSALAYIVMSRYGKARDNAAALVKQLEHASLTDPLTGLYNRRYLTARVDEEMRRAYDGDVALCVAIMDIDHFKSINDNYGHLYGDDVLITLSRTLAAGLGENAVLGRYGGEEFLILLIDHTPEEAHALLETLCGAVKAVVWPHGGQITLSCGLCAYTRGISYSKFIESADKKLYLAKENGRDQIVV